MEYETIAAPRRRPVEIARPRIAEAHKYRHEEEVTNIEEGMVGTLQELQIQAVEHNREFFHAADMIEATCSELMQRVETDANKREERFRAIQELLSNNIQEYDDKLETQVEQQYNRYTAKPIPELEEKEASISQDGEVFYKETVPKTYERAMGKLTDRLRVQKDSFEVENEKVRAREEKISDVIDIHVANTETRLQVEATDRKKTLLDAEHAWHETVLIPQRLEEERTHVRILHDVQKAVQIVESESKAREKGDNELLKDIEGALVSVQKVLVENFGQADEDDD